MTRLFVLDFDNTLIPYDSFKKYLIFLIKHGHISIGLWTFLRRCRIINSYTFKKKISNCVEKSVNLQNQSRRFVEKLEIDVVWPKSFFYLFQDSVEEICVLVLSASPECYLKFMDLSVRLNGINLPVTIVGSKNINGRFVEMYGKEKLNYIKNNFNSEKYNYIYAVSDSESDLCWMKLFNQYEIIKQ